MNDFKASYTGLSQCASGTITITDYTGLASGKTVTVGATTLTEGVDFSAATDEDTTASSLASAIDGISGYAASADGAVITIIADTPGTAANSAALETNAVSGVTLSGATLSGGVAATYTDSFDYGNDVTNVETYLAVTAKTGTLTLDVTPQVSPDGGTTWYDVTAHTQATAATTEVKEQSTCGSSMRFKIVVGGTAPTVDFTVHAIAK